jgi:hypothetical protein
VPQYGELLINLLNCNITITEQPLFEASILALNTLSGYSTATFNSLLSMFIALPVPKEGDLACLIYLIEFIKTYVSMNGELALMQLMNKYKPVLSDTKYTVASRILAMDLMIDLSTLSDDPQELSAVLDTLQLILQEVGDLEIRKKLYYLARRGLGTNQSTHPLCDALLAIARNDVRSKNLDRRKHALLLYTIFHQNWDIKECMPILFKLLSDSDQNVILIIYFRFAK